MNYLITIIETFQKSTAQVTISSEELAIASSEGKVLSKEIAATIQ